MSTPPQQPGPPSGPTPGNQGPVPPHQSGSGQPWDSQPNQAGQPNQSGQPWGPDQAPGQPGGQPIQQPAQPEGGKGKGIGKQLISLLVSVGVLIVVIIGFNVGTKWWNQRGMADQVGTCVNVTGSANSVDTEEVDCATTTFHYLIAAAVKSGESCPEGDYTTITTSQRNQGSKTEVGSLCLMPKLTADTCYVEQSRGNELTEGECTDPKALFKVSKLIDEKAPDKCEMPDQALSYAEPAKTYCLVPAGE